MSENSAQLDLIAITTDIVTAHLSNNSVPAAELPTLIRSVFSSLQAVTAPAPADDPKPEPAVPIKASVRPDYIICLEDGKKLKMLKRYLRTHYQMTPEQYRAKWGLPRDYPMVCEQYANTRRTLAKESGLGRVATKPQAGEAGKGKAPAKPRAAKTAAPTDD